MLPSSVLLMLDSKEGAQALTERLNKVIFRGDKVTVRLVVRKPTRHHKRRCREAGCWCVWTECLLVMCCLPWCRCEYTNEHRDRRCFSRSERRLSGLPHPFLFVGFSLSRCSLILLTITSLKLPCAAVSSSQGSKHSFNVSQLTIYRNSQYVNS